MVAIFVLYICTIELIVAQRKNLRDSLMKPKSGSFELNRKLNQNLIFFIFSTRYN